MSLPRPPSPGEKTGIAAILAALVLTLVDIRLAAVPLAGFLVLCLAAPFAHRRGFFLPVISRGRSGKRAVALTFDDGPDPLTTPALLRLLARHRVPSTFFVIGKKAEMHPELIRAILADGHLVGNHTYRHDTLVMLKSTATLAREIEAGQAALAPFGVVPLAFRPPVGITNPRLGKVLSASGMYVVNFTRRAGDGGNRWIRHLARRILSRVRPDDILMLHDVRPGNPDRCLLWLGEVDRLLWGLKQRQIRILPLPELIGKPVMGRRAAAD
ncbi:polysaccharide deacetylase family protein [Desulfococcus sp.]|uniref:polysaccharide deacetylase family protein n=1 Tax=Desulfococcus sp. TaxID=2025834 RepID=UPI0035948C3D